MHHIGLILNTQKPMALEVARRLLSLAPKADIAFLAPSHESSVLGISEVSEDEWRNLVKFAVVIGGDGTFLRAARYVLECRIPLYGINAGRLGFLASGDPDEAERDIISILQGRANVEERHTVRGTIIRGDRIVHELYALNDLVVTKGAFARLIFLEIEVNGHLLSFMPADGLILSSPTGSTAYALSAGGPIVPPHLSTMVLAPICAHTLYARPVVVGEHDVVTITPKGDHREIFLTQDGQLGYELLPGDRVEVSISPDKHIRILTLPERDYYYLLRHKFQWGQSYSEGSEE